MITLDIEKYGTKKAECWIGCFERTLTILFRNVSEVDIQKIENIMEEYYFEWNNDFHNMCCEEYIIENIPDKYKEKIIAIIYEEEEEECF